MGTTRNGQQALGGDSLKLAPQGQRMEREGEDNHGVYVAKAPKTIMLIVRHRRITLDAVSLHE